MSRQRSLEQDRAAAAWEAVRQIKGQSYEKEYSSLARSAPAEVQTNGLGQTLAFWRAKGYQDGKPKDRGETAHYQLLQHVQAWLRRQLRLKPDADIVAWITQEAETSSYRRATTEAVAFLGWLKRFAEAELKASESGGEQP